MNAWFQISRNGFVPPFVPPLCLWYPSFPELRDRFGTLRAPSLDPLPLSNSRCCERREPAGLDRVSPEDFTPPPPPAPASLNPLGATDATASQRGSNYPRREVLGRTPGRGWHNTPPLGASGAQQSVAPLHLPSTAHRALDHAPVFTYCARAIRLTLPVLNPGLN